MSNANRSAKALSHGRARRSRRLYATLILAGSICTVIALLTTARAANTITVNTLTDEATAGDGHCSLREAIANANSKSDTSGGDCTAGTGDDTIVFSVSGTITLGSAPPGITNTLTIDGAGTIVLDGARSYQVLYVNSGATLAVNNLTIENGFVENSATGGAGIENDGGTLTVDNTTFSHNVAYFSSAGGAIDANGGTLSVSNSSFLGNQTVYGFGGAIFNNGPLTVTNSTFSDNLALEGFGGAIYGGGTIINSTFSGNSVGAALGYHAGGAIYGTVPLTITNSIFAGNFGGRDGAGGAILADATVTVTNSTFSENGAYFGGAIEGGGTVTNCTFLGNSGPYGGAIDAGGTVTNCTFLGNSGVYGGAILNGGTVTNCTFSGNSVDGGGGILSGATVSNSILAGNSGGNCGGFFGFPPAISDEGYNISDDATCNFSAIGSAYDINPLLDSNGLQDNGGPTETIALQSSSPAIDAIPAANCLATDQRGYARPDEQEAACDIGAYESGATSSSAKLSLAPSSGSFDLNAVFVLAGSTNLLTEDVTLKIGSYSVTIPAGSFTENKKGAYVFEGTVNGASLQVKIAPQADGSYSVKAEGTGADVSGGTNPILVTLTIGEVSGGQLVTTG